MLHNFKLHAIFQRAEFINLYFLGVWMDDTVPQANQFCCQSKSRNKVAGDDDDIPYKEI